MYYARFFVFPDVSHVRETAPGYLRKQKLNDWPDDELASIRVALRKVTALRVENPDDVEDLVQETLLTMAAKCPDVRLEKGLLVWGLGILRNKVGNYYRARQSSTANSREYADSGPRRHPPRDVPSPESLTHHSELRLLVDRILADFSTREREPVDLLLAGFHTREIAASLRPERYQNVVNRIYRGRRKLASELERYGYGGKTASGRGR